MELKDNQYKSYEQFCNEFKSNRNNKIVKWEFFHPFYYIMMRTLKYFEMGEAYLNSIEFAKPTITSTFILHSHTLTKFELMTILYCYIDELIGKFIYSLDSSFFLTTSIEVTKLNEDKIDKIVIDSQNKQYKFVCVSELSETFNSGRKLTFTYKLFYLIEEEKGIKFDFLLSGSSIFKKPKDSLPMSLSKF